MGGFAAVCSASATVSAVRQAAIRPSKQGWAMTMSGAIESGQRIAANMINLI
jgi:hypothetical protein